MLKKKIWPNFPRIIEVFTQKIVTKPSKIWVWDPGSEIWDPGSGKNLFWISDPGVKKAPDPGSRIRIRNTVSKISTPVLNTSTYNIYSMEYICMMVLTKTIL
jgi:hypothetical protein